MSCLVVSPLKLTEFSKLPNPHLSQFAYAHRGLWSRDGFPENSIEACLAAAEAGLGIEFDVRPSKDGVAMVFHDAALDRMTDKEGQFEDFTACELQRISLKGGGHIFPLTDLLNEWPQTTPLLCEMKVDGKTDPVVFAETVGTLFEGYGGPVAAMSFSFKAVSSLPGSLMRGQLIDAKGRVGAETFAAALGRITAEHCDYIACHTSDVERCHVFGRKLGLPVITWTVKDVETSRRVAPFVDAQIFEGFDYALVKPH